MKTLYERQKTWRHRHPDGRNEDRKRHYDLTANASGGGEPWTQDQDRQVLAREVTDTELAAILHRSVNAIQKRRHRLTIRAPL